MHQNVTALLTTKNVQANYVIVKVLSLLSSLAVTSNIIAYFYKVDTTPNLLMQKEASEGYKSQIFSCQGTNTGMTSFSLNITFSSTVNTCNGMNHAQAT